MPEFKPEMTLALTVSDFKKSVGWYKDVLGCEPVYVIDEMGWGEFTSPVGGVTFGLGTQQAGEPVATGGGATIGLNVADIVAARSELEAKGVTFDGPNDELPGLVILATFRDPDGNAFMLAQSLQTG